MTRRRRRSLPARLIGTDVPGAPFWATVDFADGVDEDHRCGRGGRPARREPAGRLGLRGRSTRSVRPTDLRIPTTELRALPGPSCGRAGRTLAEVLVVEPDGPVPGALVQDDPGLGGAAGRRPRLRVRSTSRRRSGAPQRCGPRAIPVRHSTGCAPQAARGVHRHHRPGPAARRARLAALDQQLTARTPPLGRDPFAYQ